MEIDCLNRGLVKVSAIPFRLRDDRFYRYIGALDCDGYIEDIVISWIVKPGFCSMHYTVTLAGLKNVNRYIGNIVLSEIVISGFLCTVGERLAIEQFHLHYSGSTTAL